MAWSAGWTVASVYQRKILKSWKEIASYLGVGMRTAQRWTAVRGLPVKSPGASGRSAVLGFSDDIDRWLSTSKVHVREPLDEIITTDLLTSRPSRPRQLERELEALLEIGCKIARKSTSDVLRSIAAFALAHCKAESAGFSILGTEGTQEIFRWVATCGRMKKFERGTTPANFSPCGVCLERNSPLLLQYPARYYAYLQPIAPVAELLLIPMYDHNVGIGTIWIISHSGRRKFDAEDVRVMTNLSELASATVSATRSRSSSSRSDPKTRATRRSAGHPSNETRRMPRGGKRRSAHQA